MRIALTPNKIDKASFCERMISNNEALWQHVNKNEPVRENAVKKPSVRIDRSGLWAPRSAH